MKPNLVRVKICGITNWDDASAAVDAGADALGFNFYPPSPRSISPGEAWKIIRRLPPFVETVGVFVNWSPAAVIALAKSLQLHSVQLHGDESPQEFAECTAARRVIKAMRVEPGFSVRTLTSYRAASAFLLDGFHPRLFGGTGKSPDLNIVRRAKAYGRIILAGGLAVENVMRTVMEVWPYAVDVCSGIEKKPGQKDLTKMRQFMLQVNVANSYVRSATPIKPVDPSERFISEPSCRNLTRFLSRSRKASK